MEATLVELVVFVAAGLLLVAADLSALSSGASDARRSKAASQTNWNFTLANRNLAEEERLTRLVRDEGFFQNAVDLIDLQLAGITTEIASPSIGYVETGLRRGALEHDFQANFHLAVGAPVLNILESLVPGTFSCQSGDVDGDVTDDVWLADDMALVSGEHQTNAVVPDTAWARIEKEIDDNAEFWWPNNVTDPVDETTRVLGQIYCQLVRWKTNAAFLTTYDRYMAFYREGTVMRCSKLYRREASNPSLCKLLTSLVLAEAERKMKIKYGIRFGYGKAFSDKPTKRSDLGPPSWKILPVTEPKVMPVFVPPDYMDPEVFKDIFNRKENCPLLSTESLLKTPSTWMRWKSRYLDFNVNTTLKRVETTCGGSSPSTSGLTSSNSAGSLSGSSLGTDESEAYVILFDHLAFTSTNGQAARGIGCGGLPVVAKMADSARGADCLIQECRNYRLFQEAGHADMIPVCYGVFVGEDWTILLLQDVGATLKNWEDLSEAQWKLLLLRVEKLSENGLHHGDLVPRNICVDSSGAVKFVDLGLAEECRCQGECYELARLKADANRW